MKNLRFVSDGEPVLEFELDTKENFGHQDGVSIVDGKVRICLSLASFGGTNAEEDLQSSLNKAFELFELVTSKKLTNTDVWKILPNKE